MAAKPRINLRFRPDLLERIERLVAKGRAKNLTAALEEAAEQWIKRAERSRNGNHR
jgi:hypothetical protein